MVEPFSPMNGDSMDTGDATRGESAEARVAQLEARLADAEADNGVLRLQLDMLTVDGHRHRPSQQQRYRGAAAESGCSLLALRRGVWLDARRLPCV